MKEEDVKTVASEILSSHQAWVESGGKQGNRASFMHINFTGVMFEAELSGATFTNCNLTKATFKGKVIKDIQFINCNLTEAKLLFIEVKNIIIEGCNLSFAKLGGAHFEGGVFRKINADEAFFVKSFFAETLFSECKFSKSNFSSSALSKVILERSEFLACDFAYCNFFEGRLVDSSFKSSDFHSAEFNKTRFIKSDFTGSATFDGAKFKSVNAMECRWNEGFEKGKINDLKKENFIAKNMKNIIFYSLNLMQFGICIFCIFYFALYRIDEIKILFLGVLLSLFVYLNNSNIEDLISITNFKMKLIISTNYVVAFLMLLTLWKYSLKFENFAVSISILAILGVLGLQSFLVLKKIFKEHRRNI